MIATVLDASGTHRAFGDAPRRDPLCAGPSTGLGAQRAAAFAIARCAAACVRGLPARSRFVCGDTHR